MSETACTISLGKQPTTQSPPCDLWPGDVLAHRYRLDALLGWGGQAVVFQATDLQAQQQATAAPVAVKMVRNDLPPDACQEAVAVLRWEAYLLRKLRHSALPRLLRLSHTPGFTWLVRELMPGTSLATLINHGPCDPRQVQRWAVQLCDILTYLHTQSPPVICGDIKPSNLVLRPDGSLALIDLGAAMTRTRYPPKRARPRHGTPGYASPEQLGNQESDERSDLFSLAATCYELLTGDDPTRAPLQFDLQRLNLAAPGVAPALRWALTLDINRRAPTAAALRSALTLPLSPVPLVLDQGVSLRYQRDLLQVAAQHPHLLERALHTGMIELWLVQHPDRMLGKLLHDWRAIRRSAAAHQRSLEVFLTALAPSDGSPLLQVHPDRIQFGRIPLRQWRNWSDPQRITIYNHAAHPLRWELDCPTQRAAEARVLVDGCPVRKHSGVILPGSSSELWLVAAGQTGTHQGVVTLRCGMYSIPIRWEGTGQALLPVGPHLVARLAELDLAQPDLVFTLETLMQQGRLQRWLRAQGERALATALTATMRCSTPDTLTVRLMVAQVLHRLDPQRFPWLRLHGTDPVDLRVAAGDQATYTLEVENLSDHPCHLVWSSPCAWLRFKEAVSTLPSYGHSRCRLILTPPFSMPVGTQQVSLLLQAGDLQLPITLAVHITAASWVERIMRWFFEQ